MFPELIISSSKPSYSQWPAPVSCPGLSPVAGDAKVYHMSLRTGVSIPANPDQGVNSTGGFPAKIGNDGCSKINVKKKKNQSLFKRPRSRELGQTEGWGLSKGQKRWSPPAPVIGLPRLSARGDQSHRSCLLPDQISSHLMCLS